MNLRLECTDAALLDRARVLADALQVPLGKGESDLALTLGVAGLSLRALAKGAPGPVMVDFANARMAHRRRGGQNELLGRAVGVGQRESLHIVDATAGLGSDSYVLASLGCQVTALERSRVIYELLLDGLERGLISSDTGVAESCRRIQLVYADSVDWMRRQSELRVDVVYLDPMFPGRDKAARAKKEMWIFQQLLEAEALESPDLLEAAMEFAIYRVVVKRPLKAKPLCGVEPSHALKGKAVRFDVYTRRKIGA